MHSVNYLSKSQQKIKCSTEVVVEPREITHRINRILGDLSLLLSKLHNDSLIMNYGTRAAPAKPADLVRVVASWKTRDSIDLTLRNIMLSSILSAERMQVGAGLVCAHAMISTREDTHQIKNNANCRIDAFELDAALSYFLGRGMIYELMKTIVESGGMSATMSFDFAQSRDFIVQASTVKEFLGEIPLLFRSGEHLNQLENVIVIAVDGIIESMGELDHLLQELALRKHTAIICSTGFSPDVIVTLDHNWTAGNLRVVPFMVKDWEVATRREHPSISKAVMVCKRLDIRCVSSDAGEALASVTLEDFTLHEVIRFSKQGVSFRNKEGTSQHMHIKIPKRFANTMGIIRDRCQLAQKACIGVAKSGMCQPITVEEGHKKGRDYKILVSRTAQLIGTKAAKSCSDTLKNMGAIIAS